MKKILLLITVLAMFSCAGRNYESVKGDPTETRIYTLENGLKVYLAKKTDQPRINAVIAVKVGSKNDPAETTGLAHYFEHLMFKGSERLGTQDYAAEKPLLDSIESLFEIYRAETDQTKRRSIYAVIDSLSQEASKIAIPNEYDKLMAAIGSNQSNAWTSEDETCYIEDFPSNELENWAAIQSDRFQHPVIRGFHTELETIYEEYNMYAAMDNDKFNLALMSLLFPNHPYGQHDVIGIPEHLKNPSITNVKNYYKTYYVPNNYAICLSGDIDFDKTMDIIERWFGNIAPNKELPKWQIPEEDPITEPKEREVFGLEAEYIGIGWRAPRAAADDELTAEMTSSILSNRQCGIIEEDLINTQSVLYATARYSPMADGGRFLLYATPKEGQTLEELKQLLLQEVAKLREGSFDEKMIQAEVANWRKSRMEMMRGNEGMVFEFIDAYINGRNWSDVIKSDSEAEKLTKDDIVKWASANLRDDNYVVVYKRQGEDPDTKKIEKPAITPTESNRDASSRFLDSIQNVTLTPIAPQFADFDKDLEIDEISAVPLIYRKNSDDGLYSLRFIFETGSNANPALEIAAEYYMPLLGTADKSAMEIQKELYTLATEFNVYVSDNRTEISLSGLGENMGKALEIVEDYLRNIKGDDQILSELKKDLLKERADHKFIQRMNYSALINYCRYGKEAVKKTTLDNTALMALTSDQLLNGLKDLANTNHRIFYYGPLGMDAAKEVITSHHNTSDLHEGKVVEFPVIRTTENRVVFGQYDSKQVLYNQSSYDGMEYNPAIEPEKTVFNKYFGSDLVYQELREARGLAYTAYSRYNSPHRETDSYCFMAYIGTQNDKVRQAVETFDEIIENMPEAENNFNLSKAMILSQYETTRYPREMIFDKWIQIRDLGLTENPDKAIYERIKSMTIEEIKAFHDKYVKGRNYTYIILGNSKEVDMEFVKSLGPVEMPTQEDYFGY